MILKTRAPSFFYILLLFLSASVGAEGFNTFACLRDLLPLTDHGSYQRKRGDIEKPFVTGDKYIVFPEVRAHKVTGFYVYDRGGAYFYDTIEVRAEGKVRYLPIAGLAETKERPLYQMVAQPGGLETMTIYYMPGFKAGETNRNGPVALGASVLPVAGAFVSRPEKYDYVYQNPDDFSESRLHEWLARNRGGRAPASEQKIVRQIVTLSVKTKKTQDELWRPLKEELRLRRDWIRDHNIDNQTFIEIRRAMDGSCKEP